MRVEHGPRSSGGDVRRVASGTFVAALRRRLGAPRGAPAAGRTARTRAAPVQSVASGLRQARIEMDARVQVRLDARTESERLAEARHTGRQAEVRRSARQAHGAERWAEPAPAGPRAATDSGRSTPWIESQLRGQSQPRPPAPLATAAGLEAVLALVERVEHLLRSGRPVLAFTLGGHGQRVQLERVGPGEVGIRLHGGRFGRAEAERLALELGQRGLRLSRLEWSSRPSLP
jgi:hypothetical protein